MPAPATIALFAPSRGAASDAAASSAPGLITVAPMPAATVFRKVRLIMRQFRVAVAWRRDRRSGCRRSIDDNPVPARGGAACIAVLQGAGIGGGQDHAGMRARRGRGAHLEAAFGPDL